MKLYGDARWVKYLYKETPLYIDDRIRLDGVRNPDAIRLDDPEGEPYRYDDEFPTSPSDTNYDRAYGPIRACSYFNGG